MIAAGERLFGPYRWKRFDILVIGPNFPIGGMGNPSLSFISATAIAGDKSLVSVIARELAHSWSGNLVGNATWRDLWLNEAVSAYLESRIMNEVYGEQRASMDAVLGLKSLREDLAGLAPKDQVLAIDLRDRDPGSALRDVPYEKGRLFLNFLDAKFGRERFDAFLRGYFDHFAFKSITTEEFNQYLSGESARPLSRHRRARASARLGKCAGHSGRCRVAGVERLVAGGSSARRVARAARLPPRNSDSIGPRISGCISWTACRQRCAPSSSPNWTRPTA